jgi:trehalose/maltose hydrolase-like predicted phosphorylase
MWPPLLMLDPACAKSALQYRFDRLPGARGKAADCGTANHAACPADYSAPVEAAMFPWESAFTGHEVQFGGGKIGPWGKYEQHISGDIALAARQYWYTTNDKDWLREVGFPLANGTASFYAARLEAKAGNKSAFDYNAVMGPDEYAYPVNNSAYTNAAAQISLNFAAEAAAELGYQGAVYDAFKAKANGLGVPFMDPVPGR